MNLKSPYSANLEGHPYKDVCDIPNSKPIAQDGYRSVYKGWWKIYLVNDEDGLIIDYCEWPIYGNAYVSIQKEAQRVWGIDWHITD